MVSHLPVLDWVLLVHTAALFLENRVEQRTRHVLTCPIILNFLPDQVEGSVPANKRHIIGRLVDQNHDQEPLEVVSDICVPGLTWKPHASHVHEESCDEQRA